MGQIILGHTAALDEESMAKAIVWLLERNIEQPAEGLCVLCRHSLDEHHEITEPLEDGTGAARRCNWPKPHVDARMCLCYIEPPS